MQGGARFVVGKNILAEYIDGVTKRVSKEKAIEELDKILNSKLLVIESFSEADWDKALRYFRKFHDHLNFIYIRIPSSPSSDPLSSSR